MGTLLFIIAIQIFNIQFGLHNNAAAVEKYNGYINVIFTEVFMFIVS